MAFSRALPDRDSTNFRRGFESEPFSDSLTEALLPPGPGHSGSHDGDSDEAKHSANRSQRSEPFEAAVEMTEMYPSHTHHDGHVSYHGAPQGGQQQGPDFRRGSNQSSLYGLPAQGYLQVEPSSTLHSSGSNLKTVSDSAKESATVIMRVVPILMYLAHVGLWIWATYEASRRIHLNLNGNYYQQPGNPDQYCDDVTYPSDIDDGVYSDNDDGVFSSKQLNDLWSRILMVGAYAVYEAFQVFEFYLVAKSIKSNSSAASVKMTLQFFFKNPLDELMVKRIGKLRRRAVLTIRFCVAGLIIPVTAFSYESDGCIYSKTYVDEYHLVAAYNVAATCMAGACIFFIVHYATMGCVGCCGRSLFMGLAKFVGFFALLGTVGLGVIVMTSEAMEELINILDVVIFGIDVIVIVANSVWKVKLYPGVE